MLSRFKALSEGKEWKEQIKPFNIFLLGFQAHEVDGLPVKPLSANTIQVFIREQDILKWILAMPQKEAKRRGVDRGTFSRIKKRIRKNGEINLKTKAVQRLL